MNPFTLYLGSKNISSWSLRVWLIFLQTGADFDAVIVPLNQPDTREKISKFSPSRKVPVLKHGDHFIWDSLAIGEYLAEIFPSAKLWPGDLHMRAMARSISCEMHSGFYLLRKYLPFNIGEQFLDYTIPEEAVSDIKRVIDIWEECRRLYFEKGPFLFGKFTIADAMFAPVAIRFINYNVPLSFIVKEYIEHLMALPEMQMWCNDV